MLLAKRWLLPLLLVLFCLLSAGSALAGPSLAANQSSVSVNVKVGSSQNYYLQVTNTGNISVFNVTLFSPPTGVSSGMVNAILPNETQTLALTFAPNAAFNQQIDLRIGFYSLVTLAAENKKVFVNSTGSAFTPGSLQLFQGDTVQWKNVDNITHSVTANDSSFDQNLGPGEVFEYQFSVIKELSYINKYLFYGGTVKVVSKFSDVFAHSDALDRIVALSYNALFADTTLEVLILDTPNITVQANGTFDTSIRIRNTGAADAKQVKVSTTNTWASFSTNTFDLGAGQSKFLPIQIKPSIATSAESDKMYDVVFTAQANNTASANGTLQVFIPFTNASKPLRLEDLSKEELIKLVTDLSGQLDSLIALLNLLKNSPEGNLSLQDFNVTLNVSAQEFQAALRDMRGLKDDFGLTRVNQNQLLAQLVQQAQESINKSAEAVDLAKENREAQEVKDGWNKILVFSLIGVVFLVVLGWFVLERIKQKRRQALHQY